MPRDEHDLPSVLAAGKLPRDHETVADGFTAAIGYELSDPRRTQRRGWRGGFTQSALPRPALCIEILAEGTVDTLEQAGAQAEDASRRVLHERADEIRERVDTADSCG